MRFALGISTMKPHSAGPDGRTVPTKKAAEESRTANALINQPMVEIAAVDIATV
jgi:hypothetical protein